jgi:hypothetical protein
VVPIGGQAAHDGAHGRTEADGQEHGKKCQAEGLEIPGAPPTDRHDDQRRDTERSGGENGVRETEEQVGVEARHESRSYHPHRSAHRVNPRNGNLFPIGDLCRAHAAAAICASYNCLVLSSVAGRQACDETSRTPVRWEALATSRMRRKHRGNQAGTVRHGHCSTPTDVHYRTRAPWIRGLRLYRTTGEDPGRDCRFTRSTTRWPTTFTRGRSSGASGIPTGMRMYFVHEPGEAIFETPGTTRWSWCASSGACRLQPRRSDS